MRTTSSMLVGLGVLALVLAAWLYGSTHGVDVTPLWAVAPALLVALFIGAGVTQAGQYAQQAAQQTNGALDARIAKVMSDMLANRDAARTRQVKGDISADSTPAASTDTPVLLGSTPPGNL